MYWTPGAYFKDPQLLSGPVIKDVHVSRFQIKCGLCKRGGAVKGRAQDMTMGPGGSKSSTRFEGACVQCAHPGCHFAMHPACARMNKLFMRIKEAVSGEGVVHQKVECYCEKHTPDHMEYSEEKRRYVHKEAALDISRSYLALQAFRTDLDSLRTLCDLTRKREKIKLRLGNRVAHAFENKRRDLEHEEGPTARRTRRQIEEAAARREERARLEAQRKREEEEAAKRAEEAKLAEEKAVREAENENSESVSSDESCDSADDDDDTDDTDDDDDNSTPTKKKQKKSASSTSSSHSGKRKGRSRKKSTPTPPPGPPPPPPLPLWAQPRAFAMNCYDKTGIETGSAATGFRARTEDIEAMMGNPTTPSTAIQVMLRIASITGNPPSVGTLGKRLLFQVMDGVVQGRSASRDHNWLDFELLEIFNAVDQAECEYSDGSTRSASEHFHSVPTSLEAKHYHTVIKQPVGLANIYTRIQRGDYPNVLALTKDIKRCITNARRYNHKGSEIYQDATQLDKALSRAMSKQSTQTLERDLVMKIANVRRRQAKTKTGQRQNSPEGREKKRMRLAEEEENRASGGMSAAVAGGEGNSTRRASSPEASPAHYLSMLDSPIFNSKHRPCFLCQQHEMPDLPGPETDHPRGAWYCEDCRVNPVNNESHILGGRVSVWWDNDQQYYRGRVTAYEARSGQHRVYYDVDHDWEFLDLSRQKIIFLLHEEDSP
jgi:hypothetical protein